MTILEPGSSAHTSGGEGKRGVMFTSRALVPLLFAVALLAFALPFGTVSCGEESVSFTGLELATARAHGGDPDLVSEVNQSSGPVVAVVVCVVSLAGLVLALLGNGGQGWAAGTGLLFLALLPWLALFALADSAEGRAGYFLAFASRVAVTGARVGAVLGRRGREGRRIWPLVTLLCPFGLFVASSALLAVPA